MWNFDELQISGPYLNSYEWIICDERVTIMNRCCLYDKTVVTASEKYICIPATFRGYLNPVGGVNYLYIESSGVYHRAKEFALFYY